MEVIKRDGRKENVSFDKITTRISHLTHGLDTKYVNTTKVAQETINGLFDGISTVQLDQLSADICASKIQQHPDFGKLASRILVSNLHKSTEKDYFEVVKNLFDHGIVSEAFFSFVFKYSKQLQEMLDYQRDYNFDFFGFKTLERSYLHSTKIGNEKKIIERPQHLWMRVAIQIHGLKKIDQIDELESFQILQKIKTTYDYMSNGYFTHATPTLFNSGSNRPQLSSCFLASMDDNIENIFKTIGDLGQISKWSGGIGIHLSSIRAKGSLIKGTNGHSDGIIPLCKVLEATARYINQSGKRLGSIAVYMEPWHADIQEFIDLRKNTGDENLRARDLFLALWIPDLFMKRVQNDEMWSLMSSDVCPGLNDSYGEEFEKLYTKYESEGKYLKQIRATELWRQILENQIETGMPYISYKDHVNQKSNQKNLGVIKSSNLCVAGDTKILTKNDGWKEIKELQNNYVELWNGYEWSNSLVKKTCESSKLLQIEFSDGCEIKCTSEHQFIIPKGSRMQSIQKVDALSLKIGDKLAKIPELPVIEFENKDFNYPYTSGFYTGDGTNIKSNDYRCSYNKKFGSFCGRHKDWYPNYFSKFNDDVCEVYERNIPMLCLYGEKQELLKYLDYIGEPKHHDNKINLRLPHNIPKKYTIPHNKSIDIRLKWLSGLFDADACIASNCIQLSSIDKKFLLEIKLMCQTLGVNPKINKMHIANDRLLPDQKGGMKYYKCQDAYRLCFNKHETLHLVNIGLNTYRLKIDCNSIPNRQAKHFNKVVSITELEEYEPTYCFGEPLRNQGMFNGLLTGNCNEIVEFSDKDQTAVCNLASICLPKFVEDGKFNFHKLGEITEITTENLNNVIDVNYYPIPEAKHSNMLNRPIGLGVQGLADVYCLLKLSFDSDDARILNKKIFETIYYHSLKKSIELAKKDGPYQSFTNYGKDHKDSPFSQGIVQWMMWGLKEQDLLMEFDWKSLISDLKKYGARNSLLTALMPTASTSQIMGNCECFEPYSSNLFVRKTLAGEYTVVNEHLVKDLINLGLWNKEMFEEILYFNGSIQKIKDIPQNVKDIYKSAFELKGKDIVQQAIERGPFIDQTQSMNIFQSIPDFNKLSASHFYGWKNGLKTGMYYLRTQPVVDPIKFGLDPTSVQRIKNKYSDKAEVCRWRPGMKRPEGCDVCSA